jgi:4-hydroxyphenylpyruvate dioxygenase
VIGIDHGVASRQLHSVLKLKGFDYIELYVANARRAAYFYQTAFGFTPIAQAGLDTNMSSEGVSCLRVPDDLRAERLGAANSEALAALRAQGLLVDRDDDGVFLQPSTESIQDRLTLFVQIIQRQGAPIF